jgi:deoxyadenosine/deoxycytidine kinase
MSTDSKYVQPRYIAIEGPLRVGKSTLARILADRLHARLIEDRTDNPYLGQFYAEEGGAAFRAQMHFLLTRYLQLRFEKDRVFASLNLGADELKIYEQYFELFRPQVATPALVIYLQSSPATLRKRMKKKRDPRERDISDDYLGEVVEAYEHFFFHYSASDLLVINTSEIDFVDRHEDLQELLRRLREPVKGTQYFLPLGPG